MTLSFFYGTVMRGQPSHDVLREAHFVSEATTAARYRLLSVDDRYPALAEDPKSGASITGELYDVRPDLWSDIVEVDPEWMHRAQVELDDGRMVESMLADADQASGVTLSDISQHGGWRAFLTAQR
jgi:allophanate hydrolase